MLSLYRIGALALVPGMALAGCYDPDSWHPLLLDDTTTTTTTTTGDMGPISTLTGVTTGGSEGASSSTGGEDNTTGEAIDQAPTIVLEINGSATPAAVVVAGAQAISAFVADDRGLERVRFFLDDEPAAFAEIMLAGQASEVVEVDLPVHDASFNGLHSVTAVVRDEVMQATASQAIALKVMLPAGGAQAWRSVSESKFPARALAARADSVGDVIAVGEQAASQDGLRSRIMIRKYRAGDGKILWERTVPALAEATPSWRNVAHGVSVDDHDNVYVVAEVRPGGEESALWVGKYTHDGLLAATYLSERPKSRGNSVVASDAGQIFVAGYYLDGDMGHTATVDAFDVALDLEWSENLTVEGAAETRAYGAAIDQHGDVVVVGSADFDPDTRRGLIAVYTPEGGRLWARLLDPDAKEPWPKEQLYSVSINADNEYIAAGKRRLAGDQRRFWLVRVDDEGTEIASKVDVVARCGDEDFDNDDEGCGVALGPLDRTHLAGVLPKGSDDYLVRRTKSDWSILTWETAYDGPDQATDRGLAAAADADGFVISAGYETSGGLPRWRVVRQHP